jgi:hypothetical protein
MRVSTILMLSLPLGFSATSGAGFHMPFAPALVIHHYSVPQKQSSTAHTALKTDTSTSGASAGDATYYVDEVGGQLICKAIRDKRLVQQDGY